MGTHRFKHSFTAGELSPLMHDRVDFEKFKNGCKIMENMISTTQGPAIRRSGTEFMFDLTSLGLDINNPLVRQIPFVYSETEAYTMVFFMHTDGQVRLVLGTTKTNGEAGLVVYADPPIQECPAGGDPPDPYPRAGDPVMVKMPLKWDIEAFDWAQTNNEMYFAQPLLNPHIITRENNQCWYTTSVTMTDQPEDWGDIDDYGGGYGWPERVTFHQQRLVFAANRYRPQTVWMSVAGYNNFHNFGVLDPDATESTGDADSVTFTLDSQTQNKIQWMSSGKALHIGTLGNEWTVVGNGQTSLTPTNVLAQRQTNSGSEPVKALLIGLTTLFIERHGRTVNEFLYDYAYDSYKVSDMAILSPHITEHYSIIDWSYQQTPDSIIWCVRSDGELCGITYQRMHKVVAWHRHPTEGEFKAVTVIPGNTREDDVWLVVKRIINNEEKYYLEKMADWYTGSKASEGRFLDSFSVVDTSNIFLPYIEVPHLAGEEVQILADGMIHPTVQVSAAGVITLNSTTYDEVIVGLPYISEIRPNLPDMPQNSQTDSGSSFGRTQRISQVDIDFYRTLGGEIGRGDSEDGDTVEFLPMRVPKDNMGEEVPLFTGWYHVDFPEGFDKEPDYFIRQTQPLPMTVRGVVDISEVFR